MEVTNIFDSSSRQVELELSIVLYFGETLLIAKSYAQAENDNNLFML